MEREEIHSWKGAGCIWLIIFKTFQKLMNKIALKGGFIHLWCLLVTMLFLLLLCGSPSVTCKLVYHEVWIRASFFLQAVKELPLLNYFTIENIYISSYFPLRVCGAFLLVPLPEESYVSLHPLRPCIQLGDQLPCKVLFSFCLSPTHILPHCQSPCHLDCCIHQDALPFIQS